MGSQILIVGDDSALLARASLALKREGLEPVAAFEDPIEAMAVARKETPALVIADISTQAGTAFVRRTRAILPEVPVLSIADEDDRHEETFVLTEAPDAVLDVSFADRDLTDRVCSVLRLTSRDPGERPVLFDFGRFQIYPAEGRLVVGGEEIATPALELRLLSYLAGADGEARDAERIYRDVWNAPPAGAADKNTVSVHVHRVREKIEAEPGSPEFLLTERGSGYRLIGRVG